MADIQTDLRRLLTELEETGCSDREHRVEVNDWIKRAREVVNRPPDYLKGDRGDPGLGVNCCLCLNVKGERNPAAVVIDGYSFCEEHGDAVTEQRGGTMFYPDGRFSFSGTVKRMTQRRAELGAT